MSGPRPLCQYTGAGVFTPQPTLGLCVGLTAPRSAATAPRTRALSGFPCRLHLRLYVSPCVCAPCQGACAGPISPARSSWSPRDRPGVPSGAAGRLAQQQLAPRLGGRGQPRQRLRRGPRRRGSDCPPLQHLVRRAWRRGIQVPVQQLSQYCQFPSQLPFLPRNVLHGHPSVPGVMPALQNIVVPSGRGHAQYRAVQAAMGPAGDRPRASIPGCPPMRA